MRSPKDPRFCCHRCGEKIAPSCSICPYCDAVIDKTDLPTPYWTEVNIHDHFPTWEQAERSLNQHLRDLVTGETQSLLVIHGWGKSGRGGQIKRNLHDYLEIWGGNSLRKSWFAGETLTNPSIWNQLPQKLQKQRYLRDRVQGNPGATLILA